jgi:hypothetical protein
MLVMAVATIVPAMAAKNMARTSPVTTGPRLVTGQGVSGERGTSADGRAKHPRVA